MTAIVIINQRIIATIEYQTIKPCNKWLFGLYIFSENHRNKWKHCIKYSVINSLIIATDLLVIIGPIIATNKSLQQIINNKKNHNERINNCNNNCQWSIYCNK